MPLQNGAVPVPTDELDKLLEEEVLELELDDVVLDELKLLELELVEELLELEELEPGQVVCNACTALTSNASAADACRFGFVMSVIITYCAFGRDPKSRSVVF